MGKKVSHVPTLKRNAKSQLEHVPTIMQRQHSEPMSVNVHNLEKNN